MSLLNQYEKNDLALILFIYFYTFLHFNIINISTCFFNLFKFNNIYFIIFNILSIVIIILILNSYGFKFILVINTVLSILFNIICFLTDIDLISFKNNFDDETITIEKDLSLA